MANDADAAKRTVNGSTTVLPPVSGTQVPRLDDPPAGDARPGDRTPTDGEERPTGGKDRTDEEVSATMELTACDDEDEAGEHVEAQDDAEDGDDEPGAHTRTPGIRLALVVGLVAVLALAGLAGWFGYGAYRAHQQDDLRNLFLAVGKQGALNLTTINYADADADIRRILESSTGQFYDDFSKRAPAFVEVVKQAQAKTDGSIVEAGLESVSGDSARVLVAVLVKTSNKGATDQQPRHWRMRIDVQKVGDTVKVANVGFVP